MDAGKLDSRPDGSLRASISPKNGEGAESMQRFIQQHVLSILQPIAEHVRELQEETQQQAKDLAVTDAKVEKAHGRLDSHDQLIAALEEKIKSTKEDLARAQVEIVDLGRHQKVLEADGLATKDALGRAEGRLETTNSAVAALQKSLEETDASAHKEQVKLSQTAKLAGRLESGLAELRESHSGLCDRHLNLARGHQHTLQDCESAHQGLSRLAAKLQTQKTEAEEAMAAALARTDNLEHHLAQLRGDVGTHSKAIDFASDDVRRLSHNVGELQSRMKVLQVEDDSGAKMQSRLGKFEEILAKVSRDLATELEKDNGGRLHELSLRVNRVVADASRHGAEIRGLDATQARHDEQLRGMELHTWELETKGCKLRQRADAADSQLGSITSQQKQAALKLDMQTIALERTRAQQQQMTKEISDASTAVDSLGAEVGSARAGLLGVADRINLAHEYIEGVGRGFQDTHKHVLAGSGGMLAPKGTLGRKLPDISTPRAQALQPLGGKTTHQV